MADTTSATATSTPATVRLLPSLLQATLTVRVGVAFGNSRGGWKFDIAFELEDGYRVFREKCMTKAIALSTGPESAKKPIKLPNDSDVYLKPSKNGAQDTYVCLTVENFSTTLEHRWRLLTPVDLRSPESFRFEAFIYVRSAAPVASQFFRATAPRIETARVQRIAHEAANAVSFGPLTAHHLDIVHARRPDGTVFSVPQDNTTAQAIEIDRQRQELETSAALQQSRASVRTAVVMVQMGDLWVPMTIDVLSLRRAIGLPEHDIFTAGIYHEFTPTLPTNPDLPDFDHMEDDDDV